ncbi:hypothetical protein M9Y10_044574 [Tritrichomonas musculus]|uniref:Uncharacterized protein n=1 Tax=Tritrichomonas musculus TaxID=1915356 RepID=A0ABR2JSR8_9EUKA
MSNLSHSMRLSELQSSSTIADNVSADFTSLMLEKESNEKEFRDICDKMNQQIIETRDEIQSLMIKSSAFCATVGTKTENVVFPSKSPRHQRTPNSIANSNSLFSSTNSNNSFSTPRKSSIRNE